MNCKKCGKPGASIETVPSRHAQSPSHYNHGLKAEDRRFVYFCSMQCQENWQRESSGFWAELDKNCSDCKHFCHEKWISSKESTRNWKVDVKLRVGTCSKLQIPVEVEPMSPHNNSGQPECNDFERR